MSEHLALTKANPILVYLSEKTDFTLQELESDIEYVPETIPAWNRMGTETLNRMFAMMYLRRFEIAESQFAAAFTANRFSDSLSALHTALKEGFASYHIMKSIEKISRTPEIPEIADKSEKIVIGCWDALNNDFYTKALNREIEYWNGAIAALKTPKSKINRREKVKAEIERVCREFPINTSDLAAFDI